MISPRPITLEALWYKGCDEYSVLFERLYDQPSQRREYIESQLENASPSWGYIYLTNLIRKRVFNTVFTTNFDDLLNEACYSYSQDLRPIVCAHDSSIRSIRITSHRPKIIKLHGDFLFDNIKNTVRELESLEDNMREKFKQYAPEAGMIVVGSAGNDRSVMDTLNTLLKTDHNFPHGIYWCVRKQDNPSEAVITLSRFPRFNLVEIDGFDEFFAELHEALEFTLPDSMANPYQALTSRLNGLLEKVKVAPGKSVHPVMGRDIKILGTIVEQHSGETPGEALMRVPYKFLAEVAMQRGDFVEAIHNIEKQLNEKPTLEAFRTAYNILMVNWDEAYADRLVNLSIRNAEMISEKPMHLMNLIVPYILKEKYDRANSLLDFGIGLYPDARQAHPYFYINKAQLKLHQGKELTEDEQRVLSEYKVNLSLPPLIRWGSSVVLGDYDMAASILNSHTDSQLGNAKSEIVMWPIWKLIPEDKRPPM